MIARELGPQQAPVQSIMATYHEVDIDPSLFHLETLLTSKRPERDIAEIGATCIRSHVELWGAQAVKATRVSRHKQVCLRYRRRNIG